MILHTSVIASQAKPSIVQHIFHGLLRHLTHINYVVRLFAMTVIFIAFQLFSSAFAADKVLDIQDVVSAGGIRAWLVEDHSIPVISMQFSFRGAGTKMDPLDRQGLAQLASNTMDEGAGELDSQAFQKELLDLSISLGFGSDRDNFGGSVKTLTVNKDRAFELLQLALTKPRFDAEPLERMREANLMRIRSALMEPDWMAARIENDRIFEGHPYALNSGGTLSSLKTITAEDLRKVQARLGKNNLMVAVAGDINAEQLKILLDQVFGALPEVDLTKAEDFTLVNTSRTYLYKQDIPQTVIAISQPGIDRRDEDYHTAQVLNFILGSSGFGSRLTDVIREKRGLTYGIYTSFNNYEETDVMRVSSSTANSSAGEVLSLIRAEWEKMKTADVTPKELQDAKTYLIGAMPLSLTSTDSISSLLLSFQLDDLPIDYLDKRKEKIRHVTESDVRKLAERLLDEDKFTVVLVGNPEGIENAEIIETLPNAE